EAELRIATEPLLALPAGSDGSGLAPDVDGHGQRRWIASDLLAARPDRRQGPRHVIGRHRVQVELVGEAGRQAPGDLGAVAADNDRDARLLESLRLVDGVADGGGPALVWR